MPERFYASAGARRLLVVLHGKLAGHAGLREAVKAVRSWGHQVDVRVTWEAGDAARFAAEAVAAEADVVVAAGGDGTLNETLQGVAGAGLPSRCGLALVPLGTANDFAAGAGLPLGDPLAALRLAAEGPVRLIDLGRVNDRWFVNVVSGGPATEFTHETPQGLKDWLGPAGYVLTGMALLPAFEAVAVKLRGPEWEWNGKLLVFAVGNGKQAGGGVPLCSQASLTDGLLDMLLIPESEDNNLIGLAANLLRLHLPHLKGRMLYRQMPWLELDCPTGLRINVDGEPLTGAKFRWEAYPRQLWFCLP